MIGLTNYTTKAHLCRAALEAVTFQSREVRPHTAPSPSTPSHRPLILHTLTGARRHESGQWDSAQHATGGRRNDGQSAALGVTK